MTALYIFMTIFADGSLALRRWKRRNHRLHRFFFRVFRVFRGSFSRQLAM